MIREATLKDITEMQLIRNTVRENVLSNPALVTRQDYEDYLSEKGRSWVCVVDGALVGFAAVDLQNNNVWALFVKVGQEGKGYGKQLHDVMVNWYFAQSETPLWLSTDPGTRAERFYLRQGWTCVGSFGQQEVKFEMSKLACSLRLLIIYRSTHAT